MLALAASGVGCGEDIAGRDVTIGRDAASEDELRFQVEVARAYPAGDAVVESPLAVSVDPCQTTLHIALTDDEGLDDYDIAFASAKPPALQLVDSGGEEVMLEDGVWLRESVVFDLDPATLEDMGAGSWGADLLVEDAVVAHVPSIVRLATGDANRDGAVDSSDLVTVQQAGVYETGQEATFSSGDFDCDGDSDSADLVRMLEAPEGVAYESGPYVDPGDEAAWVDDAGRWVVTDYHCWLAAYGPASSSRVTAPPQSRPDRHLIDYSGMSIDRACSEASWTPASLEDAEEGGPSGVFYDARVSSFVTAQCAYDGVPVEDANDDLATVAETWAGGHATITSEGNAARDVRLVCEPIYNVIDGAYGERIGDDATCRLDLEGSASGRADARAHARVEHEAADQTTVTTVAPARSESELLLQFPDLSDLTPNQVAALDVPPPSLEVHGTATADADGSSGSLNIGDHTKCRLIAEWGFIGKPAIKATCFIEATGTEIANMIENMIGSFGSRGEEVEQTVHLAWAEKQGDTLDGPRRLTHHNVLSIRPAIQGPLAGKPLGQLRVYSRQVATSHAASTHAPAMVIASEATGSASGEVSMRVAAYDPDIPDAYYEEWNDEQRAEWDAANGSQCSVGVRHRRIDGTDALAPEPEVLNFVIRERGASVSLSTGNFDRRYWTGRDGTTVQSYLERFGAW